MKINHIMILSALSIITINHPAPAEVLSWPCGTNCTLTLNTETKHAVVSGTGPMNYTHSGGGSHNHMEWASYATFFKTVEINEGITSVGDGSFEGTSVEHINIPSTVTSIGTSALNNTKLQNLIIPDSVTSIGTWALNNTPNLQWLVIPDTSRMTDKSISINAPVTNIFCSGGGDTSKCDEILRQGGKNIQSVSRPSYKKDENGKIIERYEYDETGQLSATYVYDINGKKYLLTSDGKLSLKNSDGSISLYNKNGKLIGIQGKRILTVDEASALVKGNKNTFSIRYR